LTRVFSKLQQDSVHWFHQSGTHRFFKPPVGKTLRNVLQSRPTSPYSSSPSMFGRYRLESDNGCGEQQLPTREGVTQRVPAASALGMVCCEQKRRESKGTSSEGLEFLKLYSTCWRRMCEANEWSACRTISAPDVEQGCHMAIVRRQRVCMSRMVSLQQTMETYSRSGEEGGDVLQRGSCGYLFECGWLPREWARIMHVDELRHLGSPGAKDPRVAHGLFVPNVVQGELLGSATSLPGNGLILPAARRGGVRNICAVQISFVPAELDGRCGFPVTKS
jgi:hypothetical protein